jgi:peroxiredoxin
MTLKRFPHHLFLTLSILCSPLVLQGCSEEASVSRADKDGTPDFTIPLFDGGTFRLSDQRGKGVVINFFASWCRSCGKETPIIEKIAQEYSSKKIVMLGIAVDDTENKARAFMKKIGLTIPAGLDRTGKIKDAFGLYGMPTTCFIAKDGKISYSHAGVITEEILRREINKLL